MPTSSSSVSIFISHVLDDLTRAAELRDILTCEGVKVQPPIQTGELLTESIVKALREATVQIVLLGPKTRYSKWIDWEIETSLAPAKNGETRPCALLAIILPEHPDYKAPYYDPENVPLRLHDAIQWESALLRKWSILRKDWLEWIKCARRRRKQTPQPRTSFSTQTALRTFTWDKSVDSNRPPL